jgi:hypothetical protein
MKRLTSGSRFTKERILSSAPFSNVRHAIVFTPFRKAIIGKDEGKGTKKYALAANKTPRRVQETAKGSYPLKPGARKSYETLYRCCSIAERYVEAVTWEERKGSDGDEPLYCVAFLRRSKSRQSNVWHFGAFWGETFLFDCRRIAKTPWNANGKAMNC